jgi:two-component system chemotaxis response regulator CheY
MVPLNVMVVDDSVLAVQMLKNALEQLGHRVVRTAASGSEALAAYAACNPDIVTMDITMPDMDGITATRKIVQSFPDARIVMVTSHAQKGMVMEALKAGARGYVLKPLNTAKLAETLANFAGAPGKAPNRAAPTPSPA